MSTAVSSSVTATQPDLRVVQAGPETRRTFVRFRGPHDPRQQAQARALQAGIARLAEQYAADVAKLRGELEYLRKAERYASVAAIQNGQQIVVLKRMLREADAELETTRAELTHERRRSAALRQAAELPWYAAMRRREMLHAIKRRPQPVGA